MKKKIQIENRKRMGEVFTPPLLAEEMVNTLPELKVDSTILDPCAGATCVFPIMMMFKYVKLFAGRSI